MHWQVLEPSEFTRGACRSCSSRSWGCRRRTRRSWRTREVRARAEAGGRRLQTRAWARRGSWAWAAADHLPLRHRHVIDTHDVTRAKLFGRIDVLRTRQRPVRGTKASWRCHVSAASQFFAEPPDQRRVVASSVNRRQRVNARSATVSETSELQLQASRAVCTVGCWSRVLQLTLCKVSLSS